MNLVQKPRVYVSLLSVIIYLVLFTPLVAQVYNPSGVTHSLVPKSGERYLTDEYGAIRMYVNLWGHVARPGNYLVYDGIDFATLLSQSGGPKRGADFKKVTLFREFPDENGRMIYQINLEKFLKTGDRSEFVRILPNDTVIIQQRPFSYLLSQVGIVNTFMSMLNLYLSIQINAARQ